MCISEIEEEGKPTEAPYPNNGDYRCNHSSRRCPTPSSGHPKPNLATNKIVGTNSFGHRLGSTRATAGSDDEGSPATSNRIGGTDSSTFSGSFRRLYTLKWDTKALPQHDDIVSEAQPNPTMETYQTTELPHRVLESIQNHKLQVTMRELISLSSSLMEFIRSRLTEVVAPPSITPTTKELIAATEAIDKHMPVISICIGKNVVDDVLLDGGSGVNVITEEEHCKLGLPKPSPAPFNLKMANKTIAKPTGLLRDVKIHIHGIPYIVTLTVIDCQTIKSDYSMLLGRPWLRNAKVIHNWANDQVQSMGNGPVKTVKINREFGYEAVTPHALVCYNFAEGITDDEETVLLAADPTLQPVGTIDWNVLSSQLPTSTDDQTNTPDRLFPHSPGTIPVDETPIREKVKTMDVAYWTHNEQDKLQLRDNRQSQVGKAECES